MRLLSAVVIGVVFSMLVGCSTLDLRMCVINDERTGCEAVFASGAAYQGAGDGNGASGESGDGGAGAGAGSGASGGGGATGGNGDSCSY